MSVSRPRSLVAFFSSLALFAAAAAGLTLLDEGSARACGCFAPPDVSQPLVQAGEEIVFAPAAGKIKMHIKIRYSGRAGDFGWLLPLPAIPVNSQGMQGIDVGADELFEQLETRTQPTYVLQRYPCQRGGGCAFPVFGAAASDGLAREAQPPAETPLIKQDTIGPYAYAILDASNKTAMLQWLQMNGFIVPAGTDQVVGPYIRTGSYFLALKLKAGATTGDIQPVVLSYASDLPMIPITLTSVGASPHMGILVWVLGQARAIPRNYQHTVINDAQLDWLNKVKNYNDVVIKAVAEGTAKHAFVTEYAGEARIMDSVLDTPGRFAVLQTLSTQRDPVAFVKAILPKYVAEDSYSIFGGPQQQHVGSGFALNGQFYAVVGAFVRLSSKAFQPCL